VRPIDLADECRVLGDLLKHAVPKEVSIRLEVDGKPPQVLFDPAQLQQVLVNLIVNAAEAYRGEPGVVRVQVARDRDNQAMVRVDIIDQGCGMDAATQARMFEPYFTTKKTGHGLGLAAVQGICKAGGARLEFTTAPGRGTTFSVLVPVAADSGAQRQQRTPQPVAGKHLLVADDDELMRDTVVQMARQLGYSVDVATGGTEAAKLLTDPSRSYSAAVIDCVMPDRDGTEVVRELRLAGDRRPMVLVSGMVEAARIGTGILDRKTRFLAKPFSKAMFERTLLVLLRSDSDAESGSSSTFAAMQRESSVQMALRPKDERPGV
jgi:two-component system cell cycle sensor histidine kinase/response regulator CckA